MRCWRSHCIGRSGSESEEIRESEKNKKTKERSQGVWESPSYQKGTKSEPCVEAKEGWKEVGAFSEYIEIS